MDRESVFINFDNECEKTFLRYENYKDNLVLIEDFIYLLKISHRKNKISIYDYLLRCICKIRLILF